MKEGTFLRLKTTKVIELLQSGASNFVFRSFSLASSLEGRHSTVRSYEQQDHTLAERAKGRERSMEMALQKQKQQKLKGKRKRELDRWPAGRIREIGGEPV